LGRRKCLLENANEIIQCARVPEEVIADHRIARLIAKISVSEVLARFCALHFLPLNLLTEILEALQYRVQEIPRFFLMSFSCEIEHRGSKLSPSWRQICHLVSQFGRPLCLADGSLHSFEVVGLLTSFERHEEQIVGSLWLDYDGRKNFRKHPAND